MLRFIMPLILIGISVALFFVVANPIYSGVSDLRAQVESYDQALDNEKSLEVKRDELTTKENAIKPEDLLRLQKLLPDGIDNIRLILEIEQIAAHYGMALKDVKYNASNDKDAKDSKSSTASPSVPSSPMGGAGGAGTSAVKSGSKDYGVWDLEFSTTGTYSNFLNFTRDLESNLRIVDVASIQFSSSSTASNSTSSSSSSTSTSSGTETYKYSFKIKTYWLKK